MALSKVGKNQVDQSASLTVDSDLTVDTNTLYVDSTNNRVGIGTVSPASSGLDVTKAGGGNFVAQFTNTTSATPYGVWIKEPASAANGYPSLQVTDNAGTGTRFRVDSGTGYVTMPYQPSFHAAREAGHVYGNSNRVTVVFNTVFHNIGNHYNSSTGIFTAPVAGRYLFMANGMSAYNQAADKQLAIHINGSIRNTSNPASTSTGGSRPFATYLIADLSVNDTAYVSFYSNNTSDYLYASGGYWNGFNGYLIG